MSRDERAWASVKIGFLVLPALLSPGRCGGEYRPPLYWKCLFFIARESWLYLAAPGGAAQRALARGIAQAVTRHRPTWISKLKLKFEVESQIHGGDGRNGKVEAIVVAERIAPQSVPGCRLSRSDEEVRQEGNDGRSGESRSRCINSTTINENNAKGRFISCSRQLVAGGHRAGLDVLCAKNLRYFYKPYADQTCQLSQSKMLS